MDRGWIKSVHIRGDVLGPFPGSGMAIGGCHRAPKWSKMAINGHFVAISRPGGFKLVDQRGSRLDQVRAHPGRCVGTPSRVWNGHWGHQRVLKWLIKATGGPFVAISRPAASKLVDQSGLRLDQPRAHPWRWVGTFFRVWNGHWEAPYGSKWPLGLFMAFLALLWHFLTMMAIQDPEKGRNTSPRMYLNFVQP